MSMFVNSVIGRCRGNSVERRTWLAGAGVGTVLASGLAAYGVNSAIGEERGVMRGAVWARGERLEERRRDGHRAHGTQKKEREKKRAARCREVASCRFG